MIKIKKGCNLKKILYGLICSFLPISGCLAPSPPESIVYPDKNLTEIIIYGSYYPEDKKELEELIKELNKNGNCATDDSCPRRSRHLYEGESLEEALNGRFFSWGKEHFNQSESMYCYKKTKNKEYQIHKNLKARLYSQKGELLTESSLRLQKDSHYNNYLAETYLPYHEAGDKIVFVNLQGNKENIFYETKMMTQDDLQERSTSSETFGQLSWFFHKQIECHSSPNPI